MEPTQPTTANKNGANALLVFDFADPVDFLHATLQSMQATNSAFSLRAWAQAVGVKHPAVLSMVLHRRRKLLPQLATRITEHLRRVGRLDHESSRYFELLVHYAHARSDEEKDFYAGLLSTLRPHTSREFVPLQLDRFRAIADWHHSALLEMVRLKDFQPDPEGLSLRLGGNVKPSQVKDALERLERLGLIEAHPEKGYIRSNTTLVTPTDRADEGIRSYHRQMLEKATAALESQPLTRREFGGHTVVSTPEKLVEAKRRIREFRRQLGDFLETPGGSTVYQFNLQLFELIEGKETV